MSKNDAKNGSRIVGRKKNDSDEKPRNKLENKNGLRKKKTDAFKNSNELKKRDELKKKIGANTDHQHVHDKTIHLTGGQCTHGMTRETVEVRQGVAALIDEMVVEPGDLRVDHDGDRLQDEMMVRGVDKDAVHHQGQDVVRHLVAYLHQDDACLHQDAADHHQDVTMAHGDVVHHVTMVHHEAHHGVISIGHHHVVKELGDEDLLLVGVHRLDETCLHEEEDRHQEEEGHHLDGECHLTVVKLQVLGDEDQCHLATLVAHEATIW